MLYYGAKLRKTRFMLEMHSVLDPAAYRNLLCSCRAYTQTHIPNQPPTQSGFWTAKSGRITAPGGMASGQFLQPSKPPAGSEVIFGRL